MNSNKSVVRAPKITSLWRWVVSAIILALMAGLITAQTHIVRTDAIPMDLLDRWYQISEGEFSGEMVAWIEEGQGILTQIRDLESLKDRALAEAPETLAEIESLRNRFIELLKTVERARIAQMSIQELRDMRRNYLAERERELQVLDEERKTLIARAQAFLLTVDTNEFLIRHPHQSQVLQGFLFRLAELYYQDAGADLLFVEAPETAEQIEAIPKALSAPLVINMFRGGRTPFTSVAALAELGYRLVIIPSDLQRAVIKTMDDILSTIRRDGDSTAVQELLAPLPARDEAVEMDRWLDWAKEFGG